MLSDAPLPLGEVSLPDASPGDRDRAGSGPAELRASLNGPRLHLRVHDHRTLIGRHVPDQPHMAPTPSDSGKGRCPPRSIPASNIGPRNRRVDVPVRSRTLRARPSQDSRTSITEVDGRL